MRPGTLSFIEDGHMLYFTISSRFSFDSLFRINFKLSIHYRIHNLRQHIIPISMDHLNGLTDFSAGIRKLFLFSLLAASFIVIL